MEERGLHKATFNWTVHKMKQLNLKCARAYFCRKRWFLAFFFAIALNVMFILYLGNTGFTNRFLEGFSGNLIGGIIGGFLFLFLTLHIGETTENKIEEIRSISKKREEDLEREKKIRQFDQFMAAESYHNVRFIEIGASPGKLGLEYTIEPVRAEDGPPRRRKREMYSYYVVRVWPLQSEENMSTEQLNRYNQSPIREGEYYYCSFYNDEWHMGQESMPARWHKFYLSSKFGPMENGESANRFMDQGAESSGHQLVAKICIALDGTEYRSAGAGGFNVYTVFKDDQDNLSLQIDDSPLKRIYFRNPRGSFREDDYYFHIENMRGYATGAVLASTLSTVQRRLEELGIQIKRIPWHKVQ